MISMLLKKRLNTEVIAEYVPTESQEEKVIALWRTYSGQGRSGDNLRRFENSGDMEMLCYALSRGSKHTVILTNNYSEIGKISKQLREDYGVNVSVLRPGDVFKDKS